MMLLNSGGTAANLGTTVATGGAHMAATAAMANHMAQNAPKQCPSCRNTGVIPALSPGAVHHYQTVPGYHLEAQRIAQEVLASLPRTIDLGPDRSATGPALGTEGL